MINAILSNPLAYRIILFLAMVTVFLGCWGIYELMPSESRHEYRARLLAVDDTDESVLDFTVHQNLREVPSPSKENHHSHFSVQPDRSLSVTIVGREIKGGFPLEISAKGYQSGHFTVPLRLNSAPANGQEEITRIRLKKSPEPTPTNTR